MLRFIQKTITGAKLVLFRDPAPMITSILGYLSFFVATGLHLSLFKNDIKTVKYKHNPAILRPDDPRIHDIKFTSKLDNYP